MSLATNLFGKKITLAIVECFVFLHNKNEVLLLDGSKSYILKIKKTLKKY